jgi:hypothetical protein
MLIYHADLKKTKEFMLVRLNFKTDLKKTVISFTLFKNILIFVLSYFGSLYIPKQS